MKVGYDIRPALFNKAGLGRYTRELSVQLTQMQDGPFLELFAPAWRGGRILSREMAPGRFRMHRGFLPARAMHQLNRLPGLDAGRFPAPVDVFHCTDYVYPKVRSAAMVMTLHDAAFAVNPAFHGWNSSVLLDRVRRAIHDADAVIVVSEPGRADAELLGVYPEKVFVVPNGVSPAFKPAEELPAEHGYLLTVGTLEPRKNYPRILAALEPLWDADMAPDWWILGREGWEHQAFLTQLEASRHRHRIHWLKDLEDQQLVQIYQGALALVYPSLHEGFGLPVLEAMACRIPVVVGADTAPAWVAGKGGRRVDPHSVDSIREGIERIISEDWWRKQAAAVLELRSREFSWERAAADTLAVYKHAIKRFQERA
ncbi:MAG TPA: glycosyltransferase family 1 protein [Planctomycetota bacterium]